VHLGSLFIILGTPVAQPDVCPGVAWGQFFPVMAYHQQQVEANLTRLAQRPKVNLSYSSSAAAVVPTGVALHCA
jgi:hypothetical protein